LESSSSLLNTLPFVNENLREFADENPLQLQALSQPSFSQFEVGGFVPYVKHLTHLCFAPAPFNAWDLTALDCSAGVQSQKDQTNYLKNHSKIKQCSPIVFRGPFWNANCDSEEAVRYGKYMVKTFIPA
jgi:hypothetical protein